MSTTGTPAAKNWVQFRDRLCGLIDERRAVASSFKQLQVYLFLCHCRTALASPGTEEAEQALEAIVEDGSFRLVADSRSEFLAMFPVANPPVDEVGQLPESRHQAGGSGSRNVSRENSPDPPYPSRPGNPSPKPRAADEGEPPHPLLLRRRGARPF